MPKIRTVIADDHEIVRHGLKTLLENEGCEVVAEYSTGREAVEGATAHARSERECCDTANT